MPKDGDALVICRADGSTDFLVLGTGHVALRERLACGADMTDAEITQLDAVFNAMALFIATKNEAVMDALTDMANAPGVLDAITFPGLN
jgi:hypothetical protein